MKEVGKHLHAKIGQYVLLLNNAGEVLVLQRKRSKAWSLPGGRLEKSERDWGKALKREVKEETGFEVNKLKPFDIKIIEDKWQVKYCVFFICTAESPGNPALSDEHVSYKWLGEKDLEDIGLDDEPKVREVLEKFFRSENE